MEETLKKVREEQEQMRKQIQQLEARQERKEEQLQLMRAEIQSLKEIIQNQKESITDILNDLKKQLEFKESQVQVLNRWLFEIEVTAVRMERLFSEYSEEDVIDG